MATQTTNYKLHKFDLADSLLLYEAEKPFGEGFFWIGDDVFDCRLAART